MVSSRLSGVLLLAFLFGRPLAAQPDHGVIRAGDVVAVSVVDQSALSKSYQVEADGTVMVPMIGRVKADGLTPEQLAAEFSRRLAPFLTFPQVQVRHQPARKVYVFGAVKAAGPMELTADMTVLEALSRAGYSGSSEIVVVRPSNVPGPVLIDSPNAQVIRVNLRDLERELQTGQLSRNMLLADGDTIFVPNDDPNQIFVAGEVRKPGPYSVPGGATVLQTLSLAGGATERGAVTRVRVMRLVDGRQRSVRAALDDAVNPGDTVVVPAAIPLPAIDIGTPQPDLKNLPGQIHLASDPYRCHACGWRQWELDHGPGPGEYDRIGLEEMRDSGDSTTGDTISARRSAN